MPLNHAGSRGFFPTAAKPRTSAPIKTAIKGLLRGDSVDEITHRLLASGPAKVITITTTNKCNLSCKHCYLQTDSHNIEMSADDWETVLSPVLAGAGVEVLSVTGREPLLNDVALDVLNRLAESFPNRQFKMGFITNGTLIERHLDKIHPNAMDFLDVSFDGPEEDHDAVRGRGAFRRAAANVAALPQELRDRVTVLCCISANNLSSAEEMVDVTLDLGVHHLNFGFFLNSSGVPTDLSAKAEALLGAVERVEARLKAAEAPLCVTVDVDCSHPEIMLAFARRGWFYLESLEVDSSGEFFQAVWEKESAGFFIRPGLIATDLWHGVRLTADALVLASDDVLFPSEYPERALGRVTGNGAQNLSVILAQARRRKDVYDRVASSIEWLRANVAGELV